MIQTQPRHTFIRGQLGSLETMRAAVALMRDARRQHTRESANKHRQRRWLETSAVVAELDRTSERCLKVARDCGRTA